MAKTGLPRREPRRRAIIARQLPVEWSVSRYSMVYGIKAITLAFLMQLVIVRWWRAQLPVILLGRIFPRSVM